MNILYKYCDQLGIVKILGSLELKLPYISEVNDPLECMPSFYCPDDKSAMKSRCLRAFEHKGINPPADLEEKLNGQFETGELQKKLVESQRELQEEWNQHKGCLLSVSGNARETVIWAHYTEAHRGAVLGIDFDSIFHKNKGILMDSVIYSKKRPQINILEEPEEGVSSKAYHKVVMTKSDSWVYEKESRTIFLVDDLEILRQKGHACLKEFNGRKTWFLRLNPESIREVIFGLYAEDGLKSAIKKLIERPEFQHVKLYQAKESETYTLNLAEIKK